MSLAFCISLTRYAFFFYGNSANLHERLQFGRKLYIKTALQLLAIVNCFNKQPANYEAIWIT
jgi:hypothetical protein